MPKDFETVDDQIEYLCAKIEMNHWLIDGFMYWYHNVFSSDPEFEYK